MHNVQKVLVFDRLFFSKSYIILCWPNMWAQSACHSAAPQNGTDAKLKHYCDFSRWIGLVNSLCPDAYFESTACFKAWVKSHPVWLHIMAAIRSEKMLPHCSLIHQRHSKQRSKEVLLELIGGYFKWTAWRISKLVKLSWSNTKLFMWSPYKINRAKLVGLHTVCPNKTTGSYI